MSSLTKTSMTPSRSTRAARTLLALVAQPSPVTVATQAASGRGRDSYPKLSSFRFRSPSAFATCFSVTFAPGFSVNVARAPLMYNVSATSKLSMAARASFEALQPPPEASTTTRRISPSVNFGFFSTEAQPATTAHKIETHRTLTVCLGIIVPPAKEKSEMTYPRSVRSVAHGFVTKT